jgi:hypothetical protein
MYAGFYVEEPTRHSPRSCKREAEASAYYKVGVQADALDAADAAKRETEVVLEIPELALDG